MANAATLDAASHYCTFTVNEMLFGIRVGEVQEVIRFQPMTRVPLANPAVSGLINLRGQIVAAIDLRRRLGLAERPEGALPVNVVVRGDDGPVSLLVDEVGGVVEIHGGEIEPPPQTLKAGRAYIAGVCQLKDRLLLVLATKRTLDISA